MILTSITISGFKSFAKKTTIDISRNVTGIVGPNGSGKSNVSEAVRFVMGEQSMKSIRSKSMSDLIFKGSNQLASLSRASVSITIDNREKNKSIELSEELNAFLALDEIVLSREVFIDGGSVYKVNGTEVRLKDVQQILSLAGIGTSVHTIISQGEADKILLSSPAERKEMIQDALGLRVHEMRLRESEKKLTKVSEHLKTVDMLRKELSPELRHLRIQIEKINKIESERESLYSCYLNYFKYEDNIILDIKNKLKAFEFNSQRVSEIESEKNNLVLQEKEIEEKNKQKSKSKVDNEERRYELERSLAQIQYKKSSLVNEIEKMPTHASISKVDFESFRNKIKDLTKSLEENIRQSNFNNSFDLINKINNIIDNQFPEFSNSVNFENIQKQISECKDQESTILAEINMIKNVSSDNTESSAIEDIKNIYNKRQELERELAQIEKNKRENEYLLAELSEKERLFNLNLSEAVQFVGQRVLGYKDVSIPGDYNHIQIQKNIERSKIRIEEVGIIDTMGVQMQYRELSARDEFLTREIDDLTKTKSHLDSLIEELRVTIRDDFKKGLEKINFTFANFFHDIFPGGKAKIILTEEKVVNEMGEDQEVKTGVDLSISLPDKKVTDINMLSGGEKTLSSIALLFALTSIVPPPFMVLDETDAALDESNARKYGKLLAKLAEKSRLLVITHNRETMNQCDILYGITMGGDGSSKILSIKFDK